MSIWIVMLYKCFSLRFSRFIPYCLILIISCFFFCTLQPRFIFNRVFDRSNFFVILLSYLRLRRVRCVTFIFCRFLLLNISLLIVSFHLISSFRGICGKGIPSILIVNIKIIVEWRLIILNQRTYSSVY